MKGGTKEHPSVHFSFLLLNRDSNFYSFDCCLMRTFLKGRYVVANG